MPSWAAIVAIGAAGPAAASDATAVTPFLHFESGISFRGQKLQGVYVQQDTDGTLTKTGARDEIRNVIDVDLRFGAWHALDVFLRSSFDAWDRVRWEAIDFTGSAPTGGAYQTERRRGIADTTFGARYALLSEARETGDVSSWTVEASVRIPGSYEIYPSTDPEEKEAPAGTPGFDIQLATAFSKRVRLFDPYLVFFYTNRGAASASAEDVEEFNPGDQWGTFFGTEVVAFERKSDGLKLAGDVGFGWRYVMGGETFANRFIYGPDGIGGGPTGFGNVVKEDPYLRYDMRLGFVYRFQRHAMARGHVALGLPGEHYVEVYPDSFEDDNVVGEGTLRNRNFTDFTYDIGMAFEF